jgi:predicted nucleotidyltransferase component of viral defense system
VPPFTDAQIVEYFHLTFLQVLQSRLDQASYVLKGGANLRFFFDSVRYSEDIDITVEGIEPWHLTEKIDGILTSPTMRTLLRSGGVSVGEFSKLKQTEMTQRWKVPILVPGREDAVRTKIEFSRRNGETRYLLEAVPGRVVEPYAMRAPTLQHYTEDAAREQKVLALAGRSETQARDVFDLDLLLHQQPLAAGAATPEVLDQAAERALALPYAAFRDQVLPFLDPEIVELYDTRKAWEQMQSFVVRRLREAK